MLKLANNLFRRTKYSFGSITICINDDKLLKNVPQIIPINNTNIMFALSFLNINLYSKDVPKIINTRQIKKFIFLFDTNALLEPKANINIVCIATYRESIPITFGVKILLSVIVWKIIVENPMHPPVRIIAINLGILFERA